MSARIGLSAAVSAARRWISCIAAVALLASSFVASAGGPLDLVNHQPVVYANGGSSLALNLDQGTLGSRTNAQAVALVQNAIAMWNTVTTSTLRLAIGPQLPADYTTANYTNVYGRYSDGLNPVIFDTNGSLTDLLFGSGAKSSILGFAGSAYYTSGPNAGKYAEGQSVLNGYISISDAIWATVLAHEFGHFFGLDHSQLDSTQGLTSSNYVLMYPIAYRSLPTLHEDDVAAVSTLYPSATFSAVYGQLSGTFTTATGTPIRGANIWARESTTGKVYSSVSDYLTQGTGYFKLSLPAGTYTLQAESIQTNFTSGSGVGPYASSSSDVSFQSPHPITPVAMGGANPMQVTIVPACQASVTFRLDGVGLLSGNCGVLPPTTTLLSSSANPAPAGISVTFIAMVTANAPTGSVSFKDGVNTLCGAAALSGTGNARTATCTTSALSATTHSIVATYSGDAANAPSSSSALSQVISAAASSPVLSSAISRKTHGFAGTFDLPLSLLLAAPTTEPRWGPGATIIMTFNKAITNVAAAVTEGVATLSSVNVSGNSVVVNLAAVQNGQYVRVSLTNVASADGGTGGSGTVRIGFLAGDINGSRNVSLSDLLAVNSVLAQTVTASNFLNDMNLSGTLSLSDMLAVNAGMTQALPAP